jgi:hypothetical protein
MKKNYMIVALVAGSIALVSFHKNNSAEIKKFTNYHKSTSGSPGGKTGAPGDGTCTDCHSGNVQNGAAINTVTFADLGGQVTSYTPGQTYAVNVTMASNSTKNGFEIVALTPSNTQAGTVAAVDAVNTKTVSFGGKTRITHKTAGTAFTSWSFAWTAPATNVGNVTFYLATNETNNQSNGTGDVIYTSQHVIGSTASISEVQEHIGFVAAYNAENASIQVSIDTKENGDAAINIVDVNGKSVQFEQLGKVSSGENTRTVKLDNELPKGMYVLHLNVNNNFTSKKIYIY